MSEVSEVLLNMVSEVLLNVNYLKVVILKKSSIIKNHEDDMELLVRHSDSHLTDPYE